MIFDSRAIEQVNQRFNNTTAIHNTDQTKWSVKCIVISVCLNFVCYLISYTRLFMKLNLFEILLYVITKFPDLWYTHM